MSCVHFQLTNAPLLHYDAYTLLGDIARECGSTSIDGNHKLYGHFSYTDSNPYFCCLPAVCWDCSAKREQLLQDYMQT